MRAKVSRERSRSNVGRTINVCSAGSRVKEERRRAREEEKRMWNANGVQCGFLGDGGGLVVEVLVVPQKHWWCGVVLQCRPRLWTVNSE